MFDEGVTGGNLEGIGEDKSVDEDACEEINDDEGNNNDDEGGEEKEERDDA